MTASRRCVTVAAQGMRLLSRTREIRNHESPISRVLRSTLANVECIQQEAVRQLQGTSMLRPVAPTPNYPYALVGGGIGYWIKYHFGITPHGLLPAARPAGWGHGGEFSDVGAGPDDRVPFALYGPEQSQDKVLRVAVALVTFSGPRALYRPLA